MTTFIDQESIKLHCGGIDINVILKVVESITLNVDLGSEDTSLFTCVRYLDWQ